MPQCTRFLFLLPSEQICLPAAVQKASHLGLDVSLPSVSTTQAQLGKTAVGNACSFPRPLGLGSMTPSGTPRRPGRQASRRWVILAPPSTEVLVRDGLWPHGVSGWA